MVSETEVLKSLLDPSAYTKFSPVCDSYVRPETLVRICDECNFGSYGGKCTICGGPGTLAQFSFGNNNDSI